MGLLKPAQNPDISVSKEKMYTVLHNEEVRVQGNNEIKSCTITSSALHNDITHTNATSSYT